MSASLETQLAKTFSNYVCGWQDFPWLVILAYLSDIIIMGPMVYSEMLVNIAIIILCVCKPCMI